MKWLLCFVVLALGACTARQSDVPDRVADAQVLNDWSLRGRMAVKVDDDPEAGGQLSIRWEQQDEISRARLSGPMGIGAWNFVWEPARVSLADSDGERAIEYTGADAAEDFMRAELGWSFPADSVRYWVMGLPNPDAGYELRRDDDGALIGLDQHGWMIDFQRWDSFAGWYLPTRINMQGRGVRLRMVVSDWDLPAAGKAPD
jgi:outer membrane lipoprotein LolB